MTAGEASALLEQLLVTRQYMVDEAQRDIAKHACSEGEPYRLLDELQDVEESVSDRINITGDIAAEGEYRALNALYEGEMEARGIEAQQSVAKREARARALRSVSSAFSSAAELHSNRFPKRQS